MVKNLMVKLSVFCATLLLSISTSYAYNPEQPAFEKIVFFGDSLSDNGNFFTDTLGYMPKSPPYFKGRFTNGMPWSEHVEEFYQNKAAINTANFAIGGQTAIFHNPMNGYLPYTLTMSLDSYLLRSIFRDRSKTLFVIWIGSNDYLPGIKNVDELTTKVTDSIAATAESLIYHGAINVLVLNLPDLSLTPFGRQMENNATLHAASVLHNIKLIAALMKVETKYPNAKIHHFAIGEQLGDFILHPEVHNKTHGTHVNIMTESCWKGGYGSSSRTKYATQVMIANSITRHMASTDKKRFAGNTTPAPEAMVLARYIANSPALFETFRVSYSEETGAIPCLNPDDYMFWDKVHPTAIVHQMIAKDLIEYINTTFQMTIPTPN